MLRLYSDSALLNYSTYESGSESFDFLLGVAMEPIGFSSVLGDTTKALVMQHFTNLAKADRLFYLHDADLLSYVEGDNINSFINRNTEVASSSATFWNVPDFTCSSSQTVVTSQTNLQPFSNMIIVWSLDPTSGTLNGTVTPMKFCTFLTLKFST